jgi:hypothetical protein
MAGHEYICSLEKPRLKFDDGENIRCQSREDIKSSNYYPSRLTKKLPIPGYISTLAYDPPTFINNTLFNAANRPDAKNPLAFHFHLRMGCASEAVLRHTQQHVYGMQVQQGSWKKLKALLPCSACLVKTSTGEEKKILCYRYDERIGNTEQILLLSLRTIRDANIDILHHLHEPVAGWNLFSFVVLTG